MNVDVLRRQRDSDPGLAAEVDLEESRWAEITGLVDLLTPDERTAPGHFVNPDWSVKTSSRIPGGGMPRRDRSS